MNCGQDLLEVKYKIMEKLLKNQEKKKKLDMLLKKQEIIDGQHPTMKKQPSWWLKHQLIKMIVIPVVIAIVISITIIIIPTRLEFNLQETTRLQFNLQQPTSEEYLVMMTKSRQISMYNDCTNNWSVLMNVPSWVDDWSSWYASEHRIVIAGAENIVNGDRVAVLNIKSRRVKELRRLPASRNNPGVVVDGDEVYIIGGLDSYWDATNTIYYTDITQNNGWTTSPTMPTATSASVISIDSDHIYVFGGDTDDTLTQSYNKHTQQWSRGATMPSGCNMNRGRCIKEGSKFTIITADTMMQYHSNNDTWKFVKQHTRYGGYTSVVSYKGDILSCGIHKKNKISRYDSDSDDLWVETNIDVSDIADKDYLFKVCI